jgi:hypothetical protein
MPSATVAPSGSGQSEGMTPNIALGQEAITTWWGTSASTTASLGKSVGESRSKVPIRTSGGGSSSCRYASNSVSSPFTLRKAPT